jgi:hypothetical protein
LGETDAEEADMRRFLTAAAVAAVLVAPGAARAYPTGGCAAPENWPAQTASIYLQTCGISLSDALAKHEAPQAKAQPKNSGSAATPVAAGIGSVTLAVGLLVAHKRRSGRWVR